MPVFAKLRKSQNSLVQRPDRMMASTFTDEKNTLHPRMSVISDIPFIDAFIDQTSADHGALEKVVTAIRPQWKGKTITSERFREGICNTVLKCFTQEEEEAIVVRINGNRVKIFPLQCDPDRVEELKVYQVFRSIGVSPPLLGIFRNGICMEYIPGRQYTWFDAYYKSSDDPFIRTNMKELAKYHSNRTSVLAREMGFEESPAVIVQCRFLLDSLGEEVPDGLDRERLQDAIGPNFKDTLEEELSVLINRCTSLNLPLVFCHGDVNPTNIIFNETTDTVAFVDYETAGFNYAAFELARHIYLVTCSIHVDIEDRLPSDEFILEVIRVYLEERQHVDGSIRADGDTIQLWYRHVRTAMLFVFHWQIMFALNWVTNQPMRGVGDEDENTRLVNELYWTTLSRAKHYWKLRHEVLNMTIPKQNVELVRDLPEHDSQDIGLGRCPEI
ncbi:ethanolamine kinase 2-like [Lineus longissimus]|uniref:ethanolamine kinase 2-like n=1 Tax=Lineus longissimus TaxID=88925 RepID=UPI00315C6338